MPSEALILHLLGVKEMKIPTPDPMFIIFHKGSRRNNNSLLRFFNFFKRK